MSHVCSKTTNLGVDFSILHEQEGLFRLGSFYPPVCPGEAPDYNWSCDVLPRTPSSSNICCPPRTASKSPAQLPVAHPTERVPWLPFRLIVVSSMPAPGGTFLQQACRLLGSGLFISTMAFSSRGVRPWWARELSSQPPSACFFWGPGHFFHFWWPLSRDATAAPPRQTLFRDPSPMSIIEDLRRGVSILLTWFKSLLLGSRVPHRSTEVAGQLFLCSRAF